MAGDAAGDVAGDVAGQRRRSGHTGQLGHTGHLAHLARRFARSLSTQPPTPVDAAWGESFLAPAELQLWRRLGNVDRRHSLQVARRFHHLRPAASRAELAGALLHDIGKLESGLGTGLRVVASIVGPRTARLRRYHDHEVIGASWLSTGGSDPITVQLVAGSAGSSADPGLAAAGAALRIADDI